MELFKKTIETINGIDINFIALNEEIPLSELLPDYTDEEINKIYEDNVVFCAKVEAKYKGIELASDYLGGCIYGWYDDFYDRYKDDYFKDMYNNVLKDAKKEIEILKQDIKELTI